MVEIGNVTDPTRAPTKLIELFNNQVFPLVKKRLTPPYSGATAASDSYQLWLTYAKFTFKLTRGKVEVTNSDIIQATPEEEGYLKSAREEDIDAYLQWTVPIELRQRWESKGGEVRDLVDPVHFSFYLSCHKKAPERPLHMATPNNIFWHPLFPFVRHDRSRADAWVVPQSFLGRFRELEVPTSKTYFGFPFFAQTLFNWLKLPDDKRTDFYRYYLSCNIPWVSGQDLESPKTASIVPPYETLRRNWRWAEVLWMLQKEAEQIYSEDKSKSFRSCTQIRAEDPVLWYLEHYLNQFAAVAVVWFDRQRVDGA